MGKRRGSRKKKSAEVSPILYTAAAIPPLRPLTMRGKFRSETSMGAAAGITRDVQYIHLQDAFNGANKDLAGVFNFAVVHSVDVYLFNNVAGPVVAALHAVLNDGATATFGVADVMSFGNSTFITAGSIAKLTYRCPPASRYPTTGDKSDSQIVKVLGCVIDGTSTFSVVLVVDINCTLYR